MKPYLLQLRQNLLNHGWEIVERIQSDDWWADEFWKLQSRRNWWGGELIVTLLVDPTWDAPRKPGQAIWAIAATSDIPSDRLAASSRAIAKMSMVKGRFDEELAAFIGFLDAYRDDQELAK